MAATNHDPHTWGELARTVALGVQIQRRKARGKGTARLEKQVEEIRAKAQAREDARRKK
ncbi:hypothetical protein ACFV2D_13555 [Streptomyces capillispiralis]|uniref:hypothetical protein n=1 Tax=Streptomyces capillispiralis TaxID=68182 RepID=UPI0036ACEC30